MRLAITPSFIEVVIVFIILVFLFRLVTPYLTRLGNLPFFAAALGVFLVSRLFWIVNVQTKPISDFYYYFLTACDVASGNGMTREVVLNQNGWGYQLFLGAIFRVLGCSVSVGKVVNLFLGLATIPVLYLLAAHFGGKKVGRWATLLFVFWPVQWMYTSVLATEHLALPLALLGFLFGIRLLDQDGNSLLNAILCSLFLTLGAIVRPACLIYLGVVGLAILFQRKPLKTRLWFTFVLGMVFILSNSLYTLGLKIFNYGIVPSPSYSTAVSLFYGTSYKAHGMWSVEDAKVINSWPKEDAFSLSFQATWQRVKSYTPRQIASLLNAKNYEFWGAPYYGLAWSISKLETPLVYTWPKSRTIDVLPYLFQLFLMISTLVTAASLFFQGGTAKVGALLAVIVFGTAMHLILVGSSRYSYSFTPTLFILAGICFASGWKMKSANENILEKSLETYNQRHIQHFDEVARLAVRWQSWNRFYHRQLIDIYQFLVPPGLRVLEVGCGQGDLLAALKPSSGVGVDFSGEMIARGEAKYLDLRFIQADAHKLDLNETFDVIILSDLIDDLWDVETVLKQLHPLCTPGTRLILNYYSRMWAPVFGVTERLGLSTPRLLQNWLVVEDVANLLYLANFEVLRHQREILWPLPFRPIAVICNQFLAKLWPFSLLALANITIARPAPTPSRQAEAPTVSVIVPARNEAGNIPQIFQCVPEMGCRTELVFVEGHSTDNTFEAIKQAMAEYNRPGSLIKQVGKGKGDAVRLGFSKASGDVLMILDADLTVPPEDLPKFYEALLAGKGELVNGVRLVYPMDKEAMRFFNFLGNKFFSLAFSWLLGQPVKDTLCGTKVLWRKDYDLIAANRAYFGDFDPFGDYDLLFGAAKLNRKIVDLPIRYRERTYGTTNIQRWKHGWLLLRMVVVAAFRIKFA